MRSSLLVILSILTCVPLYSKAQNPSAVLVMLKAETNRITALREYGDIARAAQATHDAKMIMDCTISDFADNFNYCPVYYFVDTNLPLVKNKNFDGVLFDKEKKVYKTSPIAEGDTSFLIVYYGVAIPEIVRTGNAAEKQRVYRDPGPSKYERGFLILGHDFLRMKKSRLYLLKRKDAAKAKSTGSFKVYEYSSEEFKMSYTQCTDWLDKKLTDINKPK